MNSDDSRYCRLCAAIKPLNELVNLQFDESKRREIVDKLDRVNAATDFNEDILPRTVCFVCIYNLDRAFEFVSSIELAQTVLNDIFLVQRIKKEAIEVNETAFTENLNFLFNNTERTEVVKEENQNIFYPTVSVEEVNVRVEIEYDEEESESTKKTDVKLKTTKKKKSNNEKKTKRSWKLFKWSCSFCEMQFSVVDELISHSMQQHNRCNAFRCTDCNVRKLRLEAFVTHVRRHSKDLRSCCFRCYKTFRTTRRTNMHEVEHKDTDHICPGCGVTFQTQDDQNSHTELYFMPTLSPPVPGLPKALDDLTCVICKKTFKERGVLTKHLLIHTERKRDHKCDKCGKGFLDKRALSDHMVSHESERPFQCEICNAAFKTPRRLKIHFKVHTDEKPFACDVCGHRFRMQHKLNAHSIIHTDLFPHSCSFCNKGFRTKAQMNVHMRQHTGVRPYSCHVCQRNFTNWANYNKHMTRIHDMDMSKKKRKSGGTTHTNSTPVEITNQTFEGVENVGMEMSDAHQMLTHYMPEKPEDKQSYLM